MSSSSPQEIILTVTRSPGIITRIISDVIAFAIAYTFSFIGCDIIYNHFSLQQSIKSAYWFFLGPFLWRWGTAIPWVFEILKNFLSGEWQTLKEKIKDWLKSFSILNSIPDTYLEIPGEILDSSGPSMIENYEYIQKTREFQ